MSKFKIRKNVSSPATKITRIEVRCGSKSKILNLEHANAKSVYTHIRKKLAEIVEPISIKLPIVESPVSHVLKCRIQVFEATTDAVSKKENFKSFTCYGIDNERAMALITKFVQEN